MSAYGMKPSFTDWNGYQKWLSEWTIIYQVLSKQCCCRKNDIKDALRSGNHAEHKKLYQKYFDSKVMATKLMTLRKEAIIRWQNIKKMYAGIKQQYSAFPLTINDARNIDLHFNKKHLEFPQVPMWTLKAKGQSFYVCHLECAIPWSTKERPDDLSTKGMIRIKRGNIHIDNSGTATIT